MIIIRPPIVKRVVNLDFNSIFFFRKFMFSKETKKCDKINFCGLLRKHELYKVAFTSFKFDLFLKEGKYKIKGNGHGQSYN